MKEEKPKKKRSRKLPVFVTYEDYVRVLEHTAGLHHRLGMMLAFQSGLRISEVIALRPENVNVERNELDIIGGKGDKDRKAQLPIHWCDEVHRPLLPIACSKRALQKAFELACELSGLYKEKPTLHFHSLRHGYATFLHEQGVKIEYISKLLGHQDVSTTMIYTHLSPVTAIAKAREAWE